MHRPRPPFRFPFTLAAALAAGLACGGPEVEEGPTAEVPPPGAERAAEAIDADGLREDVARLSAEEMAGRGPGSEGDRLAQAYLVERMSEMGLEPAAPGGGWRQPFEMVGVTAEGGEPWRFGTPEGEVELAWYDEAIAFSGVQRERAAIEEAELVFVGYGIEAPEYDWDDYGDADLAGKVLVMMNDDPEWDPELFAGETRLYYGRWTYKYEKAAEKGAAGAIIIHTTPSAGYPFQVVQTSWTGEQFEIPAGDEPRIEIGGWVTEEAARRLVAAAGHDLDALRQAARSRDFEPVPLAATTSYALANRVRRVETANVLGRLPGGDPELRGEEVIYTAHHDHLGVGEPDADGDTIYDGALDNAAGVAQVLQIAEAFLRLPEPPRRSIVFAFVGAEEQGLLGSAYLARHPTVPPGRIAANINFDGGNIWGETEDITYIGYGRSSLDAVVERHAARQGRTVKGDQFPDRGFFYRSDQFNLAKVGVPAIYFDTGTEFVGRPAGWGRERIEEWEARHYHQPSDELTDAWDFSGMVQDARLGFRCGLEIARADRMPTWNEGDEFEPARRAALAEVGR